MRVKPHIKHRDGWWIVSICGDEVYKHNSLRGAFKSAHHVWRFQ